VGHGLELFVSLGLSFWKQVMLGQRSLPSLQGSEPQLLPDWDPPPTIPELMLRLTLASSINSLHFALLLFRKACLGFLSTTMHHGTTAIVYV
jgi:hypothetical protein